MRLATRNDGSRDGELAIVSPDGRHWVSARDIAPHLQAALDDWARAEPLLRQRAGDLGRGRESLRSVEEASWCAPLPRAYEWIDGSAYLNHIRLVRRSRGAEAPATLETEPLVYQGASGRLLGPNDDVPLLDPSWGLDFEAEVCVILGDTPRGTRAQDAAAYVRLLALANDVTLRNLVPGELAKGFGFFVSKPATTFSPWAVTPDELGESWRNGRVHLPLRSWLNGELCGDPDAGSEMHFSFFDLIEHVTRTRDLTAGTILGGGTVSNRDPARGVSCLAERRTLEVLQQGQASTPFLQAGDRVRIEMLDGSGRSIFGAIDQKVVQPEVVQPVGRAGGSGSGGDGE